MKTLYITNRAEWRRWLEKNYDKAKEIWLIYYKKHTNKPSISYDDAVEEGLCFGWIDSIVKRIDDERYAQKFTPRTNTTKWSESNKQRVRNKFSIINYQNPMNYQLHNSQLTIETLGFD